MRYSSTSPGATGRNATTYLIAAVVCAVGLLLTWHVDPEVGRIPRQDYLPVHMLLEFASIVVSFAVFAVGWYGYRQTANRRDLFIAIAFLAVGSMDFVHTLSYKGMPNFLGTNGVGKAAAYWVTARLIGAVALVIAPFVKPSAQKSLCRPSILLPAAVILCGGIITTFSLHSGAIERLMFTTRQGTGGLGSLTPLKITLEYTVMGLYLAAFWAFGRSRGWQRDAVRYMRLALIAGIASEACFTLYTNAFDVFNLAGHFYKFGASYLILQALFVSSLDRPYHELARLNEELRRSFARIGEALSSGLEKGTTLTLISSLARHMFDANGAAIGEVANRGTVTMSSFDGVVSDPINVPLEESVTGEVFAAGRPLAVQDLRVHPKARPEVLALGARSFMSAPIMQDGRPVGAVYVWSTEPGRYSQEDADMLTAFARHAAIAIANAVHYEKEHRIAEALQRVIFPPPNIRFGGYEIAAKYQPAWDEARVGGDFYDYFDLGDGRIGIAIGDVSGKGLDAAVHTAIAKYSFQAYVREGFSPGQALVRLNDALSERAVQDYMPDSVFITMFCAILDTKTGRMVYANAGHEPPLKFSHSGEFLMLDNTSPILGIGVATTITESEIDIEAQDTLVLYTDGVSEARIDADLFGTDGIVRAVRDCGECSPKDMADRVYDRARDHAHGTVQDDIALIVLRRSG